MQSHTNPYLGAYVDMQTHTPQRTIRELKRDKDRKKKKRERQRGRGKERERERERGGGGTPLWLRVREEALVCLSTELMSFNSLAPGPELDQN